MIGKVRLTSVSYQQFKRRLQRTVKGTTDAMIYAEWNKCLRREGHIDYERHADNLRRATRSQP